MSNNLRITRRHFLSVSTGLIIGCSAFNIADVFAAESVTPKVLLDADVAGYKLSAIDFVSSIKMITKDGTAHGPVIFLYPIPLPYTSKPITVYIRGRSTSIKDEYISISLDERERGYARRLDTGYPKSTGEWEWVQLKPESVSKIGNRLRLEIRADKTTGQALSVESIVVSTRADLNDAVLNNLPPLLPKGPVARVNKTASAPVIDGRGDDDNWKNAVAIEDFVTYRALQPAKEKTTARLLYDDQNLYLLFNNTEPLLKTSDMRGDEMRTLAQARDGDVVNGKVLHDVTSDDSCIVFLQPHPDGPVYEFDANARGVVADAKMQRNDLWGTRDLSWNSQFKAAARQGDGFWTLEMQIPLADIGAASPQTGERWQVALVRNAAGRRETSSWNPSGNGAHDPLEMGTLIFGLPEIAVAPEALLQSLQPGLNTISAQISSASPTTATMISRIQSADTKPSVQIDTVAVPGKTVNAQHQFDVAASGAVAARWGVFDAATMTPVYLSPEIHTDVQSMSASLRLSTAGAYELVLNDAVVDHGEKADNKEIALPLRAGANVIALRADAGVATMALAAPGLERFAKTWRANNAATPNATSSKLDDRTWPIITADAKSTFMGNGPTVFRRTILVNQTPVWPVPQPAVYIAGNSAQHVSFIVRGLPGKVQENWTTFLAVPKELQVLGSTGFYGTTTKSQPQFNCAPAGETTIDGQVFPLYKITADKPLLNNRDAVRSIFQVMLKIADASQAKEGVSWKLHYWSQANDGTMIEAPRSFEMRALPPLNGSQPKKLNWQLWGSRFDAMDDWNLRRDTLETMQHAGLTSIVATGNPFPPEDGKKYHIDYDKTVNFQPYSINLAPYLKDHPDEILIDHSSKPNSGMMCTTLLSGEKWPVAGAVMAGVIQKGDPAAIIYDYEFSPVDGPHSCYCHRCLAAFRERAKLSKDVNLTPHIIEDQYLAPWQDFMAWRAAQILAKMKETTHQTLAGVPFMTYSLFQSPRTLAVYGIDWRYIGQLKSVDIASAGLGRPLDDIRATYAGLDGIPLMMGVWMTPYSPDDLSPERVTTKAELLRRSLDSTAGMLVYDRNVLDGRSWTAMAETTRLLAEYESTFIAHQLAEISGQDSAKVQLLKGDQTSLVCLMNESGKPMEFNFHLPAELGAGREFYSGKTIAAGSQVQVTLAAGDTAVYILAK
jgi:hypothetical protein